MMSSDSNRVVLFLLTPFLSIPFLIHGVINKSTKSVLLLIMLIGFVSYLYVPNITNDKAYYYYLYDDLQYQSFVDFFRYLMTEKTDFIFYSLIYILKKNGIPLHYLFFTATFLTMYFWYSIFFKIWNKYPKLSGYFFLFFFCLILFAFSPSGLFSGVRFYAAVSLVLYGFASKFIVQETYYRGLIFVLLGCLTHFSCLVFLPIFLLLTVFPNHNRAYFVVYCLSFIFMLLPRESIFGNLNFLFSEGVYGAKASGYLGESDFVEESMSLGNFNNYLRFLFNSMWIYLAYLYLFVNKVPSVHKNSLLLVLSVCNVFYSAPTVYNRFIVLGLALFVFLLIKDFLLWQTNRRFLYLLFIVLFLNFCGNIYAMKDNFEKSINDISSATLVTILLKPDIRYNDIK